MVKDYLSQFKKAELYKEMYLMILVTGNPKTTSYIVTARRNTNNPSKWVIGGVEYRPEKYGIEKSWAVTTDELIRFFETVFVDIISKNKVRDISFTKKFLNPTSNKAPKLKTRLMGSAGSKDALEKLINKHFYSSDIVIIDDSKIYNKKSNKNFDDFIVVHKGGRWRLEIIDKN